MVSIDPITSLELGRERLHDLRAEAETRAMLRGAPPRDHAGRVRTYVGAALIAAGARLTRECVTRVSLQSCE